MFRRTLRELLDYHCHNWQSDERLSTWNSSIFCSKFRNGRRPFGIITPYGRFCEALNDMLAEIGVQIVDGGLNDIRIVGSITLVVLGAIVGMEWNGKPRFANETIVCFLIIKIYVEISPTTIHGNLNCCLNQFHCRKYHGAIRNWWAVERICQL